MTSKIMVDARFLGDSTGRYVERLLHHLQAIDRENHYHVLLLKKNFNKWQPHAPNFQKVLADFKPYTLREQTGLLKFLYQHRPDLVHFTMPNYPILYFRPFVITYHDLTLIDFRNIDMNPLVYRLKQEVFKLVVRCGLKFSKRIITPTLFVQNQLQSRYHPPSGKIVQTYEAAEALSSNAPSRTAQTPYQRYLLYVGNAFPYKNVHLLIDGFALLKPKFPDLGLIIVGKTSGSPLFNEQLHEYVKERNIQDVQFTGYVSDATLTWLYQHASLYVFPSLSEGFGLPGLEAMQYGVPVLSSHASCLPEVYGDAALYFDPHNPQELANTISQTLNNEPLKKDLVKKGYQQVKKYSWRRMAEETLEVYRSALGRKKG